MYVAFLRNNIFIFFVRICVIMQYIAGETWRNSHKNIPSDAVGNDRLCQFMYFVIDANQNDYARPTVPLNHGWGVNV